MAHLFGSAVERYLPALVWVLGGLVGIGPAAHALRTFRFSLPFTAAMLRERRLTTEEATLVRDALYRSLMIDLTLIGASEYAALNHSAEEVGFTVALLVGVIVRFGTTGASDANRRMWFKGHFTQLSTSSIERLHQLMANPIR